jgi:checkpoint serine/threonine-protein kinase
MSRIADWEQSKENILPLKKGRNVAILQDALQNEAECNQNRKIEQQRQMWEEKINNYQGNDPLQIWLQ